MPLQHLNQLRQLPTTPATFCKITCVQKGAGVVGDLSELVKGPALKVGNGSALAKPGSPERYCMQVVLNPHLRILKYVSFDCSCSRLLEEKILV